jgi:hypothetical protein
MAVNIKRGFASTPSNLPEKMGFLRGNQLPKTNGAGVQLLRQQKFNVSAF